MTCWYAPASACAEEQFGPSLLPLQPPNEDLDVAAGRRIALMVCWCGTAGQRPVTVPGGAAAAAGEHERHRELPDPGRAA